VKTLATGRRLGRRLLNLYLGLVLFGVSCGMIVASGLGLGPWDVFHQGVSRRIGISLGWVVVGVRSRFASGPDSAPSATRSS
jgi:uncharacterized membrane protein YczE